MIVSLIDGQRSWQKEGGNLPHRPCYSVHKLLWSVLWEELPYHYHWRMNKHWLIKHSRQACSDKGGAYTGFILVLGDSRSFPQAQRAFPWFKNFSQAIMNFGNATNPDSTELVQLIKQTTPQKMNMFHLGLFLHVFYFISWLRTVAALLGRGGKTRNRHYLK